MEQKLEELDLGEESTAQKKIAKLRKKKAKKKARARQKYAPDVSHLLEEEGDGDGALETGDGAAAEDPREECAVGDRDKETEDASRER